MKWILCAVVLLLATSRLLDATESALLPPRLHVVTSAPPGSTLAESREGSLILGFSPFGKAVVRRAIDRALAKLARPGCAGVYTEFEVRRGWSPRRVLDGMGIGPQEL